MRILFIIWFLVVGWLATILVIQAQTVRQKKFAIVLSDTQVTDEDIRKGGIDPAAATGALKFLLALEPDLDVTLVGPTLPQTEISAGEARLSSSIRRVNDSIIWTGDLRRSQKASVGLGPVVLADGQSSRPEAFSEILVLIKRSIASDRATGRGTAVYISCPTVRGTLQPELSSEFRVMLEAAIKKEPLLSHVPNETGDCTTDKTARFESSAVVLVTIDNEAASLLDIQPSLGWHFYKVPLPRFKGTSELYLSGRREF
jgi:hypothetical protein